MKTFYVRLVAQTYGEALIEADNLDEAYQIAHNLDINHMMEETECYELETIEELEQEQIELYDLPVLTQTKEGYEVK